MVPSQQSSQLGFAGAPIHNGTYVCSLASCFALTTGTYLALGVRSSSTLVTAPRHGTHAASE